MTRFYEGDRKVSREEFDQKGLGNTYNLTKDEAFRLLKQHGVMKAKDTQVLNRWLKEDIIEGVLIGKGPVQDRGWRIAEESLRNFIEFKNLTFGGFLDLKRKALHPNPSSAVLNSSTNFNETLNLEGTKPLEESRKPHTKESEEPAIKGQVELYEVLEDIEKEGQPFNDISYLLEGSANVLNPQNAELLVDYILVTDQQFQGKYEELKAKFMEKVFGETNEVHWFRQDDQRYTSLAKKTKRYVFKTPLEAIFNTLTELNKQK